MFCRWVWRIHFPRPDAAAVEAAAVHATDSSEGGGGIRNWYPASSSIPDNTQRDNGSAISASAPETMTAVICCSEGREATQQTNQPVSGKDLWSSAGKHWCWCSCIITLISQENLIIWKVRVSEIVSSLMRRTPLSCCLRHRNVVGLNFRSYVLLPPAWVFKVFAALPGGDYRVQKPDGWHPGFLSSMHLSLNLN